MRQTRVEQAVAVPKRQEKRSRENMSAWCHGCTLSLPSSSSSPAH